jgi:hypothetical protein
MTAVTSGMRQKIRMQMLYDGLPKILGGLSYAYHHILLGADGISGKSWQLQYDGDGLTLCE